MNFSKNLECLQEELGLTVAGLEKKLGLGNGYIAGLLSSGEKGIKTPGKLLVALVKHNISTDWFLTGEGEMFLVSASSSQGQELTNLARGHKVPLLRQKVSCGPGVNWQSEDNIVDYIDVFELLPRLKAKRLFAFCVEGSSMLGAGIRNGDYVLFDSAENQRLHDGIYVFALDGEVYCKRLEFDGISKKIKIYSVRVSDLEKAELLVTLDMNDTSAADRLTIFGRVFYWVHPNLDDI
jgi:phage repressor protein C with HTH and peptisase S24 domain